MGGKAFNTRGFYTPRMPPAVYYRVLEEVRSKLRGVYVKVESPIEAPGKTDHGDIDVLVLVEEGGDGPQPDDIAKLLGAKDWLKTSGSMTTHYALPWPEDEADVELSTGGSSDLTNQDRYIQLDINTNRSSKALAHNLFMHAHGDIGMILGTILRPYGLVTNPAGLYMHIPGLEGMSKTISRVLVTDDPTKILEYLGFDAKRYWSPFETWNDLFVYASSCRFFNPNRVAVEEDAEGGGPRGSLQKGAVPVLKSGVNSRDRMRANKRPLFAAWMAEFLPRCRLDETIVGGSASQMTREEVVDDAKSFFGSDFTTRFDEMREKGLRVLDKDGLWRDIRKLLPLEGGDLTVAMKGLKLEVEGRTEEEEGQVRKAYVEGRYDLVRDWVKENWEDVKTRQDKRDRAQSTAKLLTHLAKEREKHNQKQKEDESQSEE